MSEIIITDKQLSSCAYTDTINVPIEKVDVAEWLLNLPVAGYQRCCPPDHISAGTTTTDNGKGRSINVEMIGQTLRVQHYVAEVATPILRMMVSTSGAFTPNGRNRVQVIWALSVKKIDETPASTPTAWWRIRRRNSSTSSPSAAHRSRRRRGRQRDCGNRNSSETPLFAASIERRALARAGAGQASGPKLAPLATQ